MGYFSHTVRKKRTITIGRKCIERRDVELLHNIVVSKLRAAEVEQELREKLDTVQK
ncbi:hypothetical protein DYY67_2147 [Candidatus Nitrosotalea sp. TS]|uniref:hypothetical protein n=1 Tax=Candidatus Nitrosotalea sp. TS TaxID=2341020 RepID=UPI00140E87EC|nr:hypothetical protein [Candidatus Nitrosotalea sp. TS]NHI02872.1 hypothetical protein [Candidatus Nitrosotalea sp. TS]